MFAIQHELKCESFESFPMVSKVYMQHSNFLFWIQLSTNTTNTKYLKGMRKLKPLRKYRCLFWQVLLCFLNLKRIKCNIETSIKRRKKIATEFFCAQSVWRVSGVTLKNDADICMSEL